MSDTNDLTAPWRDSAECASVTKKDPYMTHAWTDEDPRYHAEASRICVEDCSVRYDCVLAALEIGSDAYGIYGGFFFTRGALTNVQARALRKDMGLSARTRQRVPRITNNGYSSLGAS